MDPEWNEKFSYEHLETDNPVIVFVILDNDKPMGVVKIPLISLVDGKVGEGIWYLQYYYIHVTITQVVNKPLPVETCPGASEAAGTLHVRATFTGSSGAVDDASDIAACKGCSVS